MTEHRLLSLYEDLLCLADLTEDNWRRKADDLAELAAWFN